MAIVHKKRYYLIYLVNTYNIYYLFIFMKRPHHFLRASYSPVPKEKINKRTTWHIRLDYSICILINNKSYFLCRYNKCKFHLLDSSQCAFIKHYLTHHSLDTKDIESNGIHYNKSPLSIYKQKNLYLS